jgi:hypothetical protein
MRFNRYINEAKNTTFKSNTYGPYTMEYMGIVDLKNNNIDDIMNWLDSGLHPKKYGQKTGATSNVNSIKKGILEVWFATKRVNKKLNLPILMKDKDVKFWLDKTKHLMKI